MSSTRRQITTPLALEETISVRRRELGYQTDSEYFTALAAYDIYIRRPHWLTSDLGGESAETREAIFREIVEHFEDAERPVTYFEHLIEKEKGKGQQRLDL